MHIPLSEMLKSIPGAIGIRLEPELPYKVIKESGDVEIREYSSFTLASTRCKGDFDSASKACFKTLAEFIFGANTDKKVTEMTTPVFYDHNGSEWVMSFYLPESVSNLKPKYPGINVEHKPGKIVAAYRYSGNFDEASMEEGKKDLLRAIQAEGLTADSNVWWAQFDQPTSLSFTKRNEALVKIQALS